MSDDESNSTDADQDQHIPAGCTPRKASEFGKGDYIMLQQTYPCRVVEAKWSQPGKHGHSKVAFTGIHVWDGGKHQGICQSHKNMPTFDCVKAEWGVLQLLDGSLSLIDDNDNVRDDLRLPNDALDEEVATRVQKLFGKLGDDTQLQLTLQTVLKTTRIIDCRVVRAPD